MGALLQFPLYFGATWNAFFDCIRDLEWLRADGIVLVVLDAPALLADGEPDEPGVLLQFLEDAARSFASGDELREAMPFKVIVHSSPNESHGLGKLLSGRNAPELLFE